jgi:hypothetical protein
MTHYQRVQEIAAGDEMLGPCQSKRRWEAAPGCPTLDVDSFRAFWGNRVTDMPQLLMQQLKDGVMINVRISPKKTKQLGLADVKSIGFVAVSYPGQGKYGAHDGLMQQDMAHRWEEVCDAPPEAAMSREFKQLIDDDLAHAVNSVQKGGSEWKRECPKGHGFWPGCSITWHGQAADHGATDERQYFRLVVDGILVTYVLCWYQLADGTRVIEAWPIRFNQRMSRL